MLLRLSALTALVLLLLVAFRTVSGDRTLLQARVEQSGIEQASNKQVRTEQGAIAASTPVSDAINFEHINFEQQWVVSASEGSLIRVLRC